MAPKVLEAFNFTSILYTCEVTYITYIVKKAIKTSSFPNNLKCAEVTPVYKKGDPLDKANYRQIIVLPCIS